MRRIATLFLFAVLFVAGCDSGGPDPDPEPQVDPPTAGFSADPTTVEVGGEVSFTAESDNATSWEWDFGDGATSSSENPSHTYDEVGTYTVSLTVSNDAGEDTETKDDYITVEEETPSPSADFSADPTETTAGEEVSFTDESENASSWEWDFGDGESSNSQNPDHTYSEEGTYTVSLTVANEEGEEDTETKEDYITVDPEPPAADFSADPTEVIVGEDVSFTDESENATAWEWEFGDGNTSTEENPIHAYEEEGSYTVSLTVSNDAGAEDTETKEDYITVDPEPTPPEADFEAEPTTVEVADTVQFTDNSTNDPTSWEWDFGDGGTSEEQNPIHVYEEPGDYDVSLTATNEDGSDTETKLGYVEVKDERTFNVKYEADATFPECDVRYENESGGSTERTIEFADRDDPWTLSIEMTVRGEFDTEYPRVRLSCYEFEANETASAKLYIDGEVFEEGEETGSSVSISLDARLTLEGAEPF